MTLIIHPDPQEPAGGFAFLELPGGSLGEGPVHVAVMEVYGERWLGPSPEDGAGKVAIGAGAWQGERHDFGAYDVHAHDGADWVRIGPEIVNKIDEYTPLRITVGGQGGDVTWDVSWPDNVPPRAGAAVLGGLQSTARVAVQDSGAALVGKPPEPKLVPEPEPEQELPENDAQIPPPDELPPKERSFLWPLIMALIVTASVGAAWLFALQDKPEVDAPEVAAPVAGQETCTRAALIALDGFGATQKAIRACGAALSPDTVLKIVEDAAEQGDPQALLLFGTLYDGAELDERIETVIGLSFEHDAARAAEYYARAAKAGSQPARARLRVTCAQLAGSQETLAKGAYDDFCG